jgi:hypothetical protein
MHLINVHASDLLNFYKKNQKGLEKKLSVALMGPELYKDTATINVHAT